MYQTSSPLSTPPEKNIDWWPSFSATHSLANFTYFELIPDSPAQESRWLETAGVFGFVILDCLPAPGFYYQRILLENSFICSFFAAFIYFFFFAMTTTISLPTESCQDYLLCSHPEPLRPAPLCWGMMMRPPTVIMTSKSVSPTDVPWF